MEQQIGHFDRKIDSLQMHVRTLFDYASFIELFVDDSLYAQRGTGLRKPEKGLDEVEGSVSAEKYPNSETDQVLEESGAPTYGNEKATKASISKAASRNVASEELQQAKSTETGDFQI
ncbi:unnamed protein product [Gongylonema pulchrum]|uniref:GCP_C_terminal domain-containing protein n=1 Tax=Gongylonema pulchrum TaxID=637853 RepID=A0A183DSP7_9BILA|nr:unnamed protein product [Gongylonema pulchrum]